MSLTGLMAVILVGCGTTPDAPLPMATKQGRQVFEGPVVVEYDVDTRLSTIDGKSCYAFLTGSVANQSPERLSRQTEVHFHIQHAGELLFSDIARLRSDLPPGNKVQFQIIESPLHNKHCPSYDRIDVKLRKIALP